MDDKIKDALERGIYGSPEIKPEERAIFLSTIVERIFIALTKKQVIHKGMYPEVVRLMAEKQKKHLYINGSLGYQLYANYVKEANKHNIPFTIVTTSNNDAMGLVLASENTAVDTEEIFVRDDLFALG